MLVIITLLWGLSFPLVKDWQTAAANCPGGQIVSSLTLIGLRMIAALLVMAIFAPRLFLLPSWRDHGVGALVGVVAFGGFIFQVVGQARTTPAMCAFITSLSSAWVPLVAFFALREKVSLITLLGLLLGVLGSAFLAINEGGGLSLAGGEVLTLVATLFFAVQILLIAHLGRTVKPGNFTMSFFVTIALSACLLNVGFVMTGPGVAASWSWLVEMFKNPKVLWALALLTVFSTILTFHWMNVYQPRVSANRAAIVYLLEPVFAAMFSVALGHESLTLFLLVGGGLILGGNCLVELPGLLRNFKKGDSSITATEAGMALEPKQR
jgi:drug/metabolite transporter (DMT)-like permease